MRDLRKKRLKKTDEDEEPSRDSRGFEALAELTTSEIVAEVKMGMSVISPIEPEENVEESSLY